MEAVEATTGIRAMRIMIAAEVKARLNGHENNNPRLIKRMKKKTSTPSKNKNKNGK